MKTLLQVRTNLRSKLDETSARFWSDADLTQFINEGARDIVRRSETLQASTSINAVANTQEYTLPSDVIRIYRVEYSQDGNIFYPLEYHDFANMDSIWWSQQKTSKGIPTWFTMWGFPPTLKLVLYPTPSSSTTNAIGVRYYRLPLEATANGDNVEVPEGWHDLVEDYAEYVALRKDHDQRWQEAKQLYEAKMGDMISVTRRWTDQADAITVGTNMVPRWLYDG